MNPFFNGPEQASIMETGGNIARRRWNVVLNASALLKTAVDRFYPDAAMRPATQAEISARAIKNSVPFEAAAPATFETAQQSAAAENNGPVPTATQEVSQPGYTPLDPEEARRQVEYATRNSA